MITFTTHITEASILATKHFTPCDEHKAAWESCAEKSGRYDCFATRPAFAVTLYNGECIHCKGLTQNTFLWALTTLPKQRPVVMNWWYVGKKETNCLTKDLYAWEHKQRGSRKPHHGDSFPNCCYTAKLSAWESMADCPKRFTYPDGSARWVSIKAHRRMAKMVKQDQLEASRWVGELSNFGTLVAV